MSASGHYTITLLSFANTRFIVLKVKAGVYCLADIAWEDIG